LICQQLLIRFATRYNQRNAGFVDQNRVGFVDHRGRERQMHLLARVKRQVIAQQIEPDLVGGGVSNVASVCSAALVTCLTSAHALLDTSYRKPKNS
jgi:hypothetical protein